MKMRYLNAELARLVYTLLPALALMAGAGSLSQASAASGYDTVRVAVLPYLSFAPLYIAKAEGLFKEQGLETEFVEFRVNANSLSAVITGRLDVDSIFTVGLLNAAARGEQVRVVANKGILSPDNCAADGFMARAGLADQLKDPDPEFLETLTFGVDPVWLDSYFLDRALARWELSIDDVSTKLVANPAARMEALGSGSLDIAFFSEPFITRIEQGGTGQMWLSAADIVPGFPLGVIIYGPTLLSADTGDDVGGRFLRAYMQGIARLQQGRTDRNVEILAEATKLDPDTLRELCWPSYDPNGRIDTRAVADYSEWAAKRGLADRPLSPDEFWEPSFVEAAGR